MITVKCVQKHKDKHNRTIGYTVMDKDGKTVSVYADALKDHIKNKRLEVINLKLTSDNRLIDIKPEPKQTVKPEPKQTVKPEAKQTVKPETNIDTISFDAKINQILDKAKTLGSKITTIDTVTGAKCYMVESGKITLLLIPDNVTSIVRKEEKREAGVLYLETHSFIQDSIPGEELKVIGGRNLEIATGLFSNFGEDGADKLDLSEFRPKLLKDTRWMFELFSCTINL